MPRDIVEFSPNVPVQVALAYGAGKIVDTRMGQRVMFTLVDGRVMFHDVDFAQRINELRPEPREPFYIVRNQEAKRGSPVQWRAWRSPGSEVGEQGDGTFVVPGNGKAAASVSAPAAISAPSQERVPDFTHTSESTKPAPPITNGWAQFLLSQTNALVDVYAAALNYASLKHGNQVKPDDIRCLVTTAYIAQTRNGGPNVA
jgi:hypothetical protein